MKWLNYPKDPIKLGEEIVVCYGENNKKEIVIWNMKLSQTNATFKFIHLPK